MSTNYEQPPVPESDNLIENQALAERMAHAEKPFRDAIFELGKAATPPTEAIRSLEVSADDASNSIGREHVQQEQAKLNDYVAGEQAKLDALRAQFGDSSEGQPQTAETLSSLERWATSVRAALVDQYERYGAHPEDFEVVSYTNDKGTTVHAVTHTAPNGLDLGDSKKDYDPARSYQKAIVERQREHQVTIDGQLHSTLGMNFALYEALVAKARQDDRELPDSAANQLSNGWNTWTLMPAEPLADGVRPRIARVVDDGSVRRGWARPDDDVRGLRFRPAVVYEEQR